MADTFSNKIKELEKKFGYIEKRHERFDEILRKIRPIDIAKYSSLVKRMNTLDDKLDHVKRDISKMDVKLIKKETDEILHKLNATLHDTLKKNKTKMQQSQKDITVLKNQLEEIRQLNVKKLLREMEVLKIKTQWLEQHVDNFDVKPIVGMIEELENRINTLTSSQPMVIE